MIHKGLLRLQQGNKSVISSPKINEIYIFLAEFAASHYFAALNPDLNKSLIWHKRLDHISEKGLMILKCIGCFGNDKIEGLDFCENCILGKQKEGNIFKIGMHKSTSILEYLHADMWVGLSMDWILIWFDEINGRWI